MKRFKTYSEECDIGKLKTHSKWDQGRYEKMKLNGMMHTQIEKVWDDEVNAERMAAQMKQNNATKKEIK